MIWTGFIWLRMGEKWWILVNMVMNLQGFGNADN
jgi:hypothetical protein